MNKIGKYLLTMLFLVFIFGFGISTIVLPDKESSYWENRTLAQKPTVTKDDILNGKFSAGYEAYITDQFTLRDGWVYSYLKLQQFTNQTFIYDYYIDKDNYVLPKPLEYFPKENIDLSIQGMNDLGDFAKEKNIELYYFNLPSRALTLKASYPDYIDEGYYGQSKEYLYSNIKNDYTRKYDLTQAFLDKYSKEQLQKLYYQTDHHWNEEGALAGFEYIYNTLNETSNYFKAEDFSKDQYEKVCANQLEYMGSFNRQIFNTVKNHSDKPCHYVSKQMKGEEFEVYEGPVAIENKVPFTKVFGSGISKASGEITYGEVFAADYRELNIVNPKKANEQNNVLIVKDSYANPLLFIIAEQYATTTVFDIRYNTDRSLYDFIEANNFDSVLVLYNSTNIYNSMYNFQLTFE